MPRHAGSPACAAAGPGRAAPMTRARGSAAAPAGLRPGPAPAGLGSGAAAGPEPRRLRERRRTGGSARGACWREWVEQRLVSFLLGPSSLPCCWEKGKGLLLAID